MMMTMKITTVTIIIIIMVVIVRKERNVLFNYELNTFYLPLYDIRNMVKNHLVRKETCCINYIGYCF